MKFLKAAVALAATMMILVPNLTHANSMNDTDSSLPAYCNRTDDYPVTTTDEVCVVLFDGLNEIDDLCSQDGMVSRLDTTQHSVYIVQITFYSNAECSLQGM